MTIVAGITWNGVTYLGADHAGSDSRGAIETRKTAKVWSSGTPIVFGVAESFRLADILQYEFSPPGLSDNQDLAHMTRYMVTQFVPALRETVEGRGLKRAGDEDPEANPFPGQLLVGIGGNLFHVEPDYQVAAVDDAYMAVGSGDMVALGALRALVELDDAVLQATDIMLMALSAAEHHIETVRSPFTIVGTNGYDERFLF